MSDDVEFDYDYLMQKALRNLMRDVLEMVAELGDAPGEHHFYIEFLTDAPGVQIPDFLKQDYPERMTIVLQHQFEDLVISENGFSVTLWFKGKQADLKIPFDTIISFADPSAQFGLRFEPVEDNDDEKAADTAVDAPEEAEPAEDSGDASDDQASEGKADTSADVVSLDAFRKK